MTSPSILTILLNYRTPAMTLKSAQAALRELAGLNAELLIVDNCSADGSFDHIRNGLDQLDNPSKIPVRLLQSGRNGGFGAGNNFGIRQGMSDGRKPDYYYILNSDAFPDKGAIRALVLAFDAHPDAGFAGSYIHGPDGEAHVTAFRFPSLAGVFDAAARFGPVSRVFARSIIALPVPERTCPVNWLAGASLMMRRDVLDQVGLFDEAFFLYFEETDLCLRAARAGFQTLYVLDSSVTHIGSVSTGMKAWQRVPGYWLNSRLHYFTKNHGPAYAAAATLALLGGGLVWQLRRVLQGKPAQDPPHFLRDVATHALGQAFKNLKPPKRGLSKLATSTIPDPTDRRDT
jgi:GT2 family glycosyltransferase